MQAPKTSPTKHPQTNSDRLLGGSSGRDSRAVGAHRPNARCHRSGNAPRKARTIA